MRFPARRGALLGDSRGRASAAARNPYRGILEGMRRVHEGFTVDGVEVVARYLDAVTDVR